MENFYFENKLYLLFSIVLIVFFTIIFFVVKKTDKSEKAFIYDLLVIFHAFLKGIGAVSKDLICKSGFVVFLVIIATYYICQHSFWLKHI